MEIGTVGSPSPISRPSDVERSDGSFTAKGNVRGRVSHEKRELPIVVPTGRYSPMPGSESIKDKRHKVRGMAQPRISSAIT